MQRTPRTAGILFLAALIAGIGTIAANSQEDTQPKSDPEVELVLDVWSSTTDDFPLKIAIRNLGHQKIPPEDSVQILTQCVLHISLPDGSRQSRPMPGWRGRAPREIARGDLAAHYTNAPVAELFPIEQEGRYLLWWTAADQESNRLVLELDDSRLTRLP